MSGARTAGLAALLILMGCDGDMDQRKDAAAAEAGADQAVGEAGADQAVGEAGADQAVGDLATPDQAAPDVKLPDQGQDLGPLADAGANVVSGTITSSGISCTSSTSTDCKGPLAVIAFLSNKPSPGSGVATVQLTSADLGGGKSVTYALNVAAVKAPTVLYLAGILADGGVMSTPPWPSGTSMTNSKLVAVPLSGSGPYKADIVLNTRAGR